MVHSRCRSSRPRLAGVLMITLSINRRPDNLGLFESGLSEYELLVDYFTECSVMIDRCLFVPPAVMNDRLKFINKTVYFCSIELRIKNDYAIGKGASIYYKDDCQSKSIADFIYLGMLPDVYFDRQPAIGYYHENPEKGYDFFLEHNSNAAVIIYIDYIKNALQIKKNRKQFCAAFCRTINELF